MGPEDSQRMIGEEEYAFRRYQLDNFRVDEMNKDRLETQRLIHEHHKEYVPSGIVDYAQSLERASEMQYDFLNPMQDQFNNDIENQTVVGARNGLYQPNLFKLFSEDLPVIGQVPLSNPFISSLTFYQCSTYPSVKDQESLRRSFTSSEAQLSLKSNVVLSRSFPKILLQHQKNQKKYLMIGYWL